jgi:hypothetical protein
MKFRKNYSGITARFISWFLGQDHTKILHDHENLRVHLRDSYSSAQNIDRIVNNIAFNTTVWRMFSRFMVENYVATESEKEMLDAEHWKYMLQLRNAMLERCADEQSSEVFMRVLKQLLVSGELSVDGLSGCEHQFKPVVGRVPKDTVGIVHIFPDVAIEQVKNHCRNAPIFGSGNAILRQLEDQGLLAERDKSRLTKSIKCMGRSMRVWSLKVSAFGSEEDEVPAESPKPVMGGDVIEFKKALANEDYGMF